MPFHPRVLAQEWTFLLSLPWIPQADLGTPFGQHSLPTPPQEPASPFYPLSHSKNFFSKCPAQIKRIWKIRLAVFTFADPAHRYSADAVWRDQYSKGASQSTSLIYPQTATLANWVQEACSPSLEDAHKLECLPGTCHRSWALPHRDSTVHEEGSRLALQALFYLKGPKTVKTVTQTYFVLQPFMLLSYTDNAHFTNWRFAAILCWASLLVPFSSSSICFLCVCVSHLCNSHTISNSFIVFVTMICD